MIHLGQAGALPNSQPPMVAYGRASIEAIMPQCTADSLVNIAQL